MGKATPLAHRQEVVSMKKAGHTLLSISESLNLTFSNVRDIWLRYKKGGDAGLLTGYSH